MGAQTKMAVSGPGRKKSCRIAVNPLRPGTPLQSWSKSSLASGLVHRQAHLAGRPASAPTIQVKLHLLCLLFPPFIFLTLVASSYVQIPTLHSHLERWSSGGVDEGIPFGEVLLRTERNVCSEALTVTVLCVRATGVRSCLKNSASTERIFWAHFLEVPPIDR
jgi:hypothetical protein